MAGTPPGDRAPALWRGLGPDRDDAAGRIRAPELSRDLGRPAVHLDAPDVLGWGVAGEVRRRFDAVDEILRIAPRRRAHHLRDAIVHQTYLLYAPHRDEDIDQIRRVHLLDVFLREERAARRMAAPFEIDVAARRQRETAFDGDSGQLDDLLGERERMGRDLVGM